MEIEPNYHLAIGLAIGIFNPVLRINKNYIFGFSSLKTFQSFIEYLEADDYPCLKYMSKIKQSGLSEKLKCVYSMAQAMQKHTMKIEDFFVLCFIFW